MSVFHLSCNCFAKPIDSKLAGAVKGSKRGSKLPSDRGDVHYLATFSKRWQESLDQSDWRHRVYVNQVGADHKARVNKFVPLRNTSVID